MFRRFIDPLAEKLVRAASARRTIHGIPVWVLNDGEYATDDALFDKAGAALDLIVAYQPWRIGSMRKDFGRIFIRRNEGCRAMFDLERSCVLDNFFVATFAPQQVAASIVHEGVHARLRRGGRRVPPELIAWEERLCRRAELGFGLRIPDGAAVVERARASLSLSDAEVAPLTDAATLARAPRAHRRG